MDKRPDNRGARLEVVEKQRRNRQMRCQLLIWAVILTAAALFAGGSSQAAAKAPAFPAPVIEKTAARESGAVLLYYSGVEDARWYHIYRASESEDDWTELSVTKNLYYKDTSGTAGAYYRYRVSAAGKTADGTVREGKKSKAVKVKVRKKPGKTAYTGDSVMTGFTIYKIIKNTAGRKVFAEKGLSTVRFYNGQILRRILQYNPDRLYIMLGVNSLVGSPGAAYLDKMVSYYQKALTVLCRKNPDMEIYAVGVAPVGKTKRIKQAKVREYNQKLKKMIQSFSQVRYCDLNPVLADSTGKLKKQYSAGDGIHWKKATYPVVLRYWNQYAAEDVTVYREPAADE